MNVKMLADILTFRGYQVHTASGGREGLQSMAEHAPDLVLLDVMMPEMNGYEVCKAIRADPATEMTPVVMVTALDPAQERVKGIEAGADDFLSKPINQAELLARVRSLLRIKAYQDTIAEQARELKAWNETLGQRVHQQVAELESLGRLKGFFSPELAQAIVSGGANEILKPHRREITVLFLDLRGFTAFTESAEPEEVLGALAQYHELVGSLVSRHQGMVEHFAGDGMMIFFNDPIPLPDAPAQAATMALTLMERFASLRTAWRRQGHELDLGIGMAVGYATLGAIGFEGRREYAAIGSVNNLSARLCSEAQGGQILTNLKTLNRIEDVVLAEPVGERILKGFAQPVSLFNITGLRG